VRGGPGVTLVLNAGSALSVSDLGGNDNPKTAGRKTGHGIF